MPRKTVESLDTSYDTENQYEIGIDEAGRGPLAGAVFAAAVILDPAKPILGLADSKKLSEKKRDALAIEIKTKALAWAIASSSVEEIDEINILQATMRAMNRALNEAYKKKEFNKIIIDGNYFKGYSPPGYDTDLIDFVTKEYDQYLPLFKSLHATIISELPR